MSEGRGVEAGEGREELTRNYNPVEGWWQSAFWVLPGPDESG